MYQPFTFRTLKTDELSAYQAKQSGSPCVIVSDKLKKSRYDVLGIFTTCIGGGDTQCFFVYAVLRDFTRSRFDVFRSTYLHDATGTYKVISVHIVDNYRKNILIRAQKTETSAMLEEAFAMHLANLDKEDSNETNS